MWSQTNFTERLLVDKFGQQMTIYELSNVSVSVSRPHSMNLPAR